MTIRVTRGFLSCLVALAIVSGCAISEEEKPNLKVIHEVVLHADMRAMAKSLGRIAETNMDSTMNDKVKLDRVLDELELIDSIAAGIGGEEAITNYSVINQYMGAFLYDVAIAREFALREPPNYFPANRLIQSCLGCHQSL